MEKNVANVLLETLIKNALKELKDSPDRTIRNLVNLASDFSEGRFQKYFFAIAQQMLENEYSPYYDLIKDVSANVNINHLLRFGLNVGHNSCHVGARRIREREQAENYNIPWTVMLEIDNHRLENDPASYDSVLDQGEAIGIYTWMVRPGQCNEDVIALLTRHPKCAFVLFAESAEVNEEILSKLSSVENAMLGITYDDHTADLCAALRKDQIPYSFYVLYDETNLEFILNGDLFYSTEQLHPIFTAVAPTLAFANDRETRTRIYEAIVRFRKEQLYQTIPWDLISDNEFVDSVISEDSCAAFFNSEGKLYVNDRFDDSLCLFEEELAQIFKKAFPK